jgi:hypothetical protein
MEPVARLGSITASMERDTAEIPDFDTVVYLVPEQTAAERRQVGDQRRKEEQRPGSNRCTGAKAFLHEM